ncbi:helix-turn-helix transcriptional regulator [Flavobacterium sp.]|uniref:helix-turn-helix domain-containing protein n=1 Tax=Flavobacterium sp. TaxID=239 RepID=UPI00286E61A2|nr:helix-turn-helix transcriptional regulator [Flavobacterium sp.]
MIGEKIRKIRTLKGFSQEYMSEKLKISQPAYSDIENSKTKVSIDTIQELATIFDISANDLINFDESQVFNNTFNQDSKGFFNVKKFINETFEHERKSYQDQVQSLKEEVVYLRGKLDEISRSSK